MSTLRMGTALRMRMHPLATKFVDGCAGRLQFSWAAPGLTSALASVIVDSVRDERISLVTHGQGRKGWLLVWALVLRVAALFLFAELSGLPHTAIDVYESLAGVEHHDADDCDSEAGHECPPGCPNCHCFHAAAAAPAVHTVETALTPLPAFRCKTGVVPYVGLLPPHADLDSLYRPPRFQA